VVKTLVCLASTAAMAAAAGCGTRNVEVLSTTTTSPTAVTVSPSSEPISNVVVTGVIGSINTTGRSIVVSGTTVSVPSGVTILSRNASLTFADLQIGQTVTIQANRSGSTITALEIFIENGPGTFVQIEGQVSGVTGTCPSLTFKISGTSIVSTSPVTMFAGRPCSQLSDGAGVRVDGYRQSDGSIAATSVSQLEITR
jgi:hypothetical protein